jgi:hypothetical protein
LGNQCLDHADGTGPARIGGQDRFDRILKKRGRTEQASLRSFFDVRQLGLLAGQRVEGGEILPQPQHPLYLLGDFCLLRLTQWAVHLNTDTTSHFLDQHLHDPT